MKKNLFIKMSLVLTLVLSLVVLTGCKKKFMVTFDSDGGTPIEAVEVKKGKKVERPADPTKEGYTFVEWTLNGSTYDFDKKVKDHITLVAQWKKNTPPKPVKVEAPRDVKMSQTEITWSPVDNATGYVVYVNGNAKEVTNASISLSDVQSYLNNVDDVICVVAKHNNSESAASLPIIKKGRVTDTEINDLKKQIKDAVPSGTQLPFTNEQLSEMVRTLKKYNTSYSEVMKMLDSIDTSTPENEMKTLMELLNHPKFAAFVELSVTNCFSNCDSAYNSLTNVQYPAFTQNDQNFINIYYERIGMNVSSMNSRLYNNVMVPWIASIVGAMNLSTNGGTTPVSTSTVSSSIYTGTMMCGWYFTRIRFSATREADTIQFTVGREKIETTVTELRDNVMTIMNSIANMSEEHIQAFMNYFNNNIYAEAARYLKAIKPDFDGMAKKVKGALNVYFPVFVEGMNNLFAMNETIESLTTALNEIAAQMQNLQTEEQVKALIASMNGFKNQAIDALVATLPTYKQCNAIVYFMSMMLGVDEEEKAMLEQKCYENLTQLNKTLLLFKELDLTKYDMQPILAAMTNPTEEAVAAAKQVIKQMFTDIIAKMPETEPVPQPTVDEIANQIMAELEKAEESNFPVLTIINVIFGKEIQTSNIKNAINFVNELAEYIANYDFDKDALMAIAQNAMINGGPLSEDDTQTLIYILIDLAKGYVTEDRINEVAPTVLDVLSLVLPEERLSTVKAAVKVITNTNNLETVKKYAPLVVESNYVNTVDELRIFLDKYLAYMKEKENYDGFVKIISDFAKEINAEISNIDIPTQAEIINGINELKKLVGKQKYELTAEQIQTINNLNTSEGLNLGIDIYWVYPEADCFRVEYDAESGNYLFTLDTTLLNGTMSSYHIKFEGPGYGSGTENITESPTSFTINPYSYMSYFDRPVQKVVLSVYVNVGNYEGFGLELDITDCFSEILMLK